MQTKEPKRKLFNLSVSLSAHAPPGRELTQLTLPTSHSGHRTQGRRRWVLVSVGPPPPFSGNNCRTAKTPLKAGWANGCFPHVSRRSLRHSSLHAMQTRSVPFLCRSLHLEGSGGERELCRLYAAALQPVSRASTIRCVLPALLSWSLSCSCPFCRSSIIHSS